MTDAAQLTIENGVIRTSIVSPMHDAEMHEKSGLAPIEEYSNHNGTVDEFVTSVVTGAGAATPDATNHKILLTTGAGSAGYSIYRTKQTFTIPSTSALPLIMSFRVRDIVNGTGGDRLTSVGLSVDFTSRPAPLCAFRHENDNTWDCFTQNQIGSEITIITAPVNGDILTIIATKSKIMYFVNGVLVATHTLYIRLNTAAYIGAVVDAIDVNTSAARTLSIDFMGLKVFR